MGHTFEVAVEQAFNPTRLVVVAAG